MNLNPLDKSGFTMAVSVLWGKITDKLSALSKVAYSGKYIDLTGKPSKLSEFENDAGFKTTDTTYGVVSKTANGLAPKLPNETTTTKYLRQDGTWAVPPNTTSTYANMSGASASAAGKAGLVPAPAAGAHGKYLRGDGTWQTPPDTNTTYGAATQSVSGLMTPADKRKLDGVSANANNYSHPTTAGNIHIPAGGAANQFLKWLRDGVAQWASLGAAAFASLANNLATTEQGFAMDARMGPVIDTRFVDMETQIAELNSALESTCAGQIETFNPYFVNPGDSDMSGISYKMGNVVFFTITGMPKLSTTNEGYIRGLPYAPNSNYMGNFWSSGVACGSCSISSNRSIILRKADTTTLTYKDIANRNLFISGFYLINV